MSTSEPRIARRRVAFGTTVLIAACLVAAFGLSRHPQWPSDGYVYAQMMLRDVGYSKDEAIERARDFYLNTPTGKDERYRPFFLNDSRGMFSTQSKPFASRILYPYLASRFYSITGFHALIIVSLSAYVAEAVGLYFLLSLFAIDWVAATVTLAVMATPMMRGLGSSAITDMLAINMWTFALGTALLYLRSTRLIWLGLFLLFCIALALSRPAVYLPLGLACGVLVFAVAERNRSVVTPALLLLTAAVLGVLTYLLASYLTHTPGIGTHLHWLYERALSGWFYSNGWILSSGERHSFIRWYLHDVSWTITHSAARSIREILPSMALITAAVGLYEQRSRLETAALVGAVIAGALSITANPVVTEVPRLVEAPLYPIVAVGLAIFVSRIALDNVLRRTPPSARLG